MCGRRRRIGIWLYLLPGIRRGHKGIPKAARHFEFLLTTTLVRSTGSWDITAAERCREDSAHVWAGYNVAEDVCCGFSRHQHVSKIHPRQRTNEPYTYNRHSASRNSATSIADPCSRPGTHILRSCNRSPPLSKRSLRDCSRRCRRGSWSCRRCSRRRGSHLESNIVGLVRKVNFGEPGSRQGLSVGEDGCTLVKERVKVNDYKNYTEKRRLKTDKDKRRFERTKSRSQ